MMVRETNQREIEERLADTRALVDDTAFGIREISAELRPAALDYAGLSSALEDYLEQFARRSGIAVVADLHPLNGRTSAAEETALFRIAQEALTNIVKHAKAITATVALRLCGDEVELMIADDGCGFSVDPAVGTPGLGLINMREIAELTGGVFELSSALERGTTIRVTFGQKDGGHG